MSNLSPSPIDSIAECLAKAAQAAQGLDSAESENLRALLHIAACEASRLGKAKRKPAASAKPAAKSAKKPVKAAPAIEAKASPKRPKNRKAAAANGAAAH
ncbi:MAG: hypothetical protein ACLP02_01655 [Rhodomicrobium sp.]